jgi:hypothetical protein
MLELVLRELEHCMDLSWLVLLVVTASCSGNRQL